MSAVPIKNYDPKFINAVTHPLTGAQLLYYLMHTWEDDPSRLVTLWCRRGEAYSKANSVRVALSKERRARRLKRVYELRVSSYWPYTHEGIKGEAINIERVEGTLQTQMRAALQEISKGTR